MSPQQKVYLDPKLKEAYDSVMSIKTSLATPPPPSPPTPQEPTISPLAWPASGLQTISPPPTFPPQPHIQPNPIPESTIIAYNSPTQNKDALSKKWSWRWILVAFLIVAFLLGYAIFWTKIFNLKLPFLP